MNATAERFYAQEPLLRGLVSACQKELGALEVWLFGSRARGDNEPDSDWDLLTVLPDEVPDDYLECEKVYEIGMRSGVDTDLIAVRDSDFREMSTAVTSLCYQVADEGVRLDG